MVHAKRVLLAIVVAGCVGWMAAAGSTMFEGRPDYRSGSQLSYFVWKDGDTWHVRWTTGGAAHHFSGRVTSEGGDLKSLKRIDADSESRLIASGRPGHLVVGPRGRLHRVGGRVPVVATRQEDRIDKDGDRAIRFSSRNDGDIDGFDFKVSEGADRLRFLLEIDGRSRAVDIQVGRDNREPPGDPFIVNLY